MEDRIRLNKFLAERLGVSRREADDLIASDEVKVNGKVAVLGMKITSTDEVVYNDQIVPFPADFVYLLFHKPEGYVCSKRKQAGAPTLYELLPPKYRALKTVGRLDKNSSGLIILTNDGDYAYRMTHPKFDKVKIYEVELDRELEPLHQQMIADFGIDLEDGKSQLMLECMGGDRKRWRVTMHEGRNRQIRRTFKAVGYEVKRLHRTAFGPYHLNFLPAGDWMEVEKL